jgi:hypothetical protein
MSNKKGLKVNGQNDQSGGTMISSSSVTTFDLSNLVESVVEGILAGHGYRMPSRSSVGNDSHHARRRSRLTPPGMKNDVSVSFVPQSLSYCGQDGVVQIFFDTEHIILTWVSQKLGHFRY